MLVRIYKYLVFCMCFIAAYGLFAIKEKVSILNYQYNEVSKQVVKEQDAIHFLKAEFAYLASPDRLKKLSSTHLQLDSIKTPQMIKDPLSPSTSQAVNENTHFNLAKSTTRWRYKKPISRYLQTISNRR